jgi:alpha-tubulin suppressor-like RCC1 family protein
MDPRSPILPLAALALTAGACNLVFGIVPGEPGAGGGGTGGSLDAGPDHDAGTGGAGGTGGSGATGGTGGAGGGPTCVAGSASCSGAVLHACGADGHPRPDVTCPAVAACDAAAGACIADADLPRLSVGEGRSCALLAPDDVRCWGVADYGSLVLGDLHAFIPRATLVPGITGARQLAAGSTHQCLLTSDGAVQCWGFNDDGQLGDANAAVDQLVKAQLPAGVIAVEVGSGDSCSCARTNQGALYCWGATDADCIGTPTTTHAAQPTPTLVPGVSDAVQIAVRSPTCARRATGKVTCWDSNIAPTDVPDIDDAVDVAVGRSAVFIRTKSKGTVWTAADPGGAGWRAPAAYLIDGAITSMVAGDSFCATRPDGVVICALLGDGLPPPMPTTVPGPPSGTVVELSAGRARNYARGLQCLRVAGAPLATTVYCWGDDTFGAVGIDAPDIFRAPQAVTGLSGVATLSAGAFSTVSVQTDGTVRAWGVPRGLLSQTSPVPKAIGFLGNDNAAVTTNDFSNRAYAVKKTGALVLLADAAPSPGQRLAGAGFADFVSARDFHYWDVGRRAGGGLEIYAALDGANDGGIFGDGTTVTMAPQYVAVGINDASAVAAYGYVYDGEPAHLCAIRTGGALWCWGDNYLGEVGDGGPPGVVSAPAAVAIPNGEAIVSVAVGSHFTCAVSAAGKVYCWGDNGYGQLGDPGVSSFPMPDPVLGISTAVGVTAGEAHACAWLADKTALCWGANDSGQLGDGSLDDRHQATVVPGLADVVEMTAGIDHTCARHGSGAVSCWGLSYDGQVGTNVTGTFPSPTLVKGL